MNYCKDLQFQEKPDYSWMRGLMEQLFQDLNYVDDGKFDWVIHKENMLAK